MKAVQLDLFSQPGAKPKEEPKAHEPEPLVASVPLNAHSSLEAAITAYHEQMKKQNLSKHTIQAFGGDLNLFHKHVGANIPINTINSETIVRYLNWLKYERGVPCSPKSYQRRLTTLKVFFAWLFHSQVITDDPAAPIAHVPVTPPLPEVLYPAQVTKLLDHARSLCNAEKSDARPYLLAMLVLATGVKKSEVMALKLGDIDASDPKQGVLYVRYDEAKKRFKERKLKLPPEFIETLPRYIEQYHPREHLFECTARNLEYVLADLAQATGLGDTVSFESLRWTCALQDYDKGMPEDLIRQKLGLTTITWTEAGERLKRLASKPL